LTVAKIKKKSLEEIDCSVHVGSGNVFADLELPCPELRQTKALISILIQQKINGLGLKEDEAASLLRIRQEDLSRMLRGMNKDFSLVPMRLALFILDEKNCPDDEFCARVRTSLDESLADPRVMAQDKAMMAQKGEAVN